MLVQSWRSPDFKNEKYVVSYLLSGQGPASSLNSPAMFVLEYRSTENEIQLFAPGTHLSPASESHYYSYSMES